MSEDDTVECEHCGESFHKQGIGAHKAHCSDATDSDGDSHSFEDLEAQAFARDDEQCVRCGSQEALEIHQIDRSVGADRNNLATLCEVCLDDVAGLHPITKRTQIYHSE